MAVSAAMRYLTEYRDYMAEQCKRFRNLVFAEETVDADISTNGKSWTAAQEHIKKEKHRYAEYYKQGKCEKGKESAN